MAERLVADIGGTNARFAFVNDDGATLQERTLSTSNHAGLVDAVRHYLGDRQVDVFVVAVATPVNGDLISFTNNPWTFSIEKTRLELGLTKFIVINDFVAQALAVMALDEHDTRIIRAAKGRPGNPVLVIGPGTGLGVATLVAIDRSLDHARRWRYAPLPSEGGHMSFAPQTDREYAMLRVLKEQFGHVSYERVVSGPGITNIAAALAKVDGRQLDTNDPAEIVNRAREQRCVHCSEVLLIFSRALGSIMGDLALALLADRIFLVGGLCRRLDRQLDQGAMIERFLAKGRLSRMLEDVSIVQPLMEDTGLAGVALFDTNKA